MSLRCSMASDSGPDSTKTRRRPFPAFPKTLAGSRPFSSGCLAPEPVHRGVGELAYHVGAQPCPCSAMSVPAHFGAHPTNSPVHPTADRTISALR